MPWKAFASAPGPVLFGEQLEMMRGLTCKFSLAAPPTEAGEMHFPSVGPRAGRARRRPRLAASTRQAGYWVCVLFSSEESAFSNRAKYPHKPNLHSGGPLWSRGPSGARHVIPSVNQRGSRWTSPTWCGLRLRDSPDFSLRPPLPPLLPAAAVQQCPPRRPEC